MVDSTPTLHGSLLPRIVVPSGGDGDYYVGATVPFATNGTNRRVVYFEVNPSAGAGSGTPYGRTVQNAVGSIQTYITTYTLIRNLAGGDFIVCTAWQDSGGGLNANLSSGVGAQFWAERAASS
ncbi:MAG: hypothetical protein H0V07_00600 [Propionibacteriales bacterium]|nr:hypothetical protein [Propionibacteriales bacterium]